MNPYTRSYPNIPKLPREEEKKESWLTTVTAGIMCIVIIGIIWAVLILASNIGPY